MSLLSQNMLADHSSPRVRLWSRVCGVRCKCSWRVYIKYVGWSLAHTPSLIDKVKSMCRGVTAAEPGPPRPTATRIVLFYDPSAKLSPGVFIKQLG